MNVNAPATSHMTLAEFLSDYPMKVFTPCAYYDKHMDCIRVQIRDCSVTEQRVDELFTVLKDNYRKEGQSLYVGFTIKGVNHLFSQLSIPLEGVVRVADVLHQIVRDRPQATVDLVVDRFQQLLNDIDLEIDFAEAA